MKSTMKSQHSFAQVPTANIRRSSFDRSNGYKTTFDAGYLVPIYLDEVLPGDTHNVNMTGFARLATPIFPIMDNMRMETFFFFVPLRLIWTNFVKFMGERDSPADSIDYICPTSTSTASTGYGEMSLQDYMGLPTKIPGYVHNTFYLRAYNLIYNSWFRDQNLQDSITVDKGDGPDTPTNYILRRRGKRHDYFTSGLPWPQKGTAVSLPLGTKAPVLGIGKVTQNFADSNQTVYESSGASRLYQFSTTIQGTGENAYRMDGTAATGGYPTIYADLTNATAATINQLRQAEQIQVLLERDARGGTRYTELVYSHFRVKSPDARLQRPEYLGGGSSFINVSPVAQTSSTDATTPQGSLAAIGTAVLNNHGFIKSFTEHGVILGMVNVRADLNYQQGLNRMWSRSTRYDFYWPELANIGEQTILNKEIYTQGTANPTADAGVFAYQERYGEYRYRPSLVTGLFRTNATGTLDSWHLAQNFSALPTLNTTFIQDDPPVDRVIAVPAEPHFLFDSYFNVRSARPMPMFGVPQLGGHF